MIKKRVLLVTPFCPPSVGGAETHLEDLYEYLRTHGYYVYVLTYQPITMKAYGLPIERRENLEIHRFTWIGYNLFHKFESLPPVVNFLYLNIYLLIRSLMFMATHYREVDVIHAHGLGGAFIAMVLKNIFKKRALMSTMALYCFKQRTLFAFVSHKVLNSMDVILAETRESKEEMMRIGVPESKITIFSHWVDQNRFKPGDKETAKRELGFSEKFVALFVGRAIPLKGGDTLAALMPYLNPEINIVVISDAGPLLDLFKETAKKYSNFIYMGGVNYRELHHYYKAADVFIIPSRYEEGAARVMMEAVSCGVPVVASNRGAIPSVLDKTVAVFVDPNEKEIGEALKELCQNPENLRALAANCFPYAQNHFGFANAEIVARNY